MSFAPRRVSYARLLACFVLFLLALMAANAVVAGAVAVLMRHVSHFWR